MLIKYLGSNGLFKGSLKRKNANPGFTDITHVEGHMCRYNCAGCSWTLGSDQYHWLLHQYPDTSTNATTVHAVTKYLQLGTMYCTACH